MFVEFPDRECGLSDFQAKQDGRERETADK
jgi:hypothetical protein